jgi:hypothetical protein
LKKKLLTSSFEVRVLRLGPTVPLAPLMMDLPGRLRELWEFSCTNTSPGLTGDPGHFDFVF